MGNIVDARNTFVAALIAIRREARKERADYKHVIGLVDAAIGEEVVTMTAEEALESVLAVIDRNARDDLGAKLVEIGHICDAALARKSR
jgi:hypothetical protein